MRQRRLPRPAEADETGAVLLLALIFVLSVGLLIGVLVNLVETNLLATSSLSQQRALEEAADGALEMAIQTVRYTPVGCASPVVHLSSDDLKTEFGYSGGTELYVGCSDGVLPGERQVMFCAGPSATAPCSSAPSAGEYARAQVLYGDVAAPTPGCAVSCPPEPGASLTIESWSLDIASH
jgi:hypothetical protein